MFPFTSVVSASLTGEFPPFIYGTCSFRSAATASPSWRAGVWGADSTSSTTRGLRRRWWRWVSGGGVQRPIRWGGPSLGATELPGERWVFCFFSSSSSPLHLGNQVKKTAFMRDSEPFCLSSSGGHLRLRSRQGGRAVVPGGRHHLRDQEEWWRMVRGCDERDHRPVPRQLRGVHHALCRLMKPLPTLGGQQAFDGPKRSEWRSKTVETGLVGGGESLNEVRLDMRTKHDHYIRLKLHVTLLWFFWLDFFMKTLRCLSFFYFFFFFLTSLPENRIYLVL